MPDNNYFHVKRPKTFDKIIKYNQGQTSMKIQFISYVHKESKLGKTHTYNNNPEKLSTRKRIKHILCNSLLFTHYLLDTTKCKHVEVKLYEKLNNNETIVKAQR